MQVRISSIVVKNRIRKDLGDIDALVESFRKYGQLTPIIINRKNELLAGERRLEAAKRLNWQTINAIVVDKNNDLEKLEIEMEENIQRKKLTEEELSEGIYKLERLKRPNLIVRILKFIKGLIEKLIKFLTGR